MRQVNIIPEYNIITKFFHWMSVFGLVVQIPLGFYLVDMDFSDNRILIEDIHVILGLSIFCLLYTSPSPRDATLSRMPSSA